MTTYSLSGYAGMLNDPSRMPAYLEALRRCVRPGSVVVDLGAGFGYFSLIACRLGASKVYAIEPAGSVQLLAELARLNGFGDRVVVVQDLSTRVSLPEKADVIVADIRGALPTLRGSLGTMIDARERFLAPGGVLMPRRDRLLLAPVESRAHWLDAVEPWIDPVRPHELTTGLNLDPVCDRLKHAWRSTDVNGPHLLAAPKAWAEIDYHTITSKDVEGKVEFVASRRGTLHGWASWFEAEVMEGIRYSTGPDNLPTVYGRGFFPIQEPLPLEVGDRLEIHVQSNDVAGDYYLRWRTKHWRDTKLLASFDQGDFYAQALDLDRLKQRLPTHMPKLKPEGNLARAILEGASAGRSMGEIADELLSSMPGRFDNRAHAIDFAAQLLDRLNG